MQKFRHKGEMIMLNEKVMEKIFSHKEAKIIPIGYQSMMIDIFGDVLEKWKGEKPYATLSELLDDTESYVSEQLSTYDE